MQFLHLKDNSASSIRFHEVHVYITDSIKNPGHTHGHKRTTDTDQPIVEYQPKLYCYNFVL